MSKEWNKWEPIKDLSEKYYIDSFFDNIDELKIKLSEISKKNKIQLTFNCVNAYNKTDETYQLEILAFINEKYGKNFYGNWTFFKITNSEFLNCIAKQNYNTDNLIHFAIMGADSILDIISSKEPIVEFIT